MANMKRGAVRNNFAVMWQNIHRYRYQQMIYCLSRREFEDAAMWQRSIADAHERASFYLNRLLGISSHD